jgi:glycosyltransferase involved in cell wall biosynthesis
MILFYSNQPVIQYSGKYFSKMKNFIDFLSLLSGSIIASKLVVPCKQVVEIDIRNYVEIKLPPTVMQVSWYEGHKQALVHTFTNAIKIRKAVKIALQNDETVIVAGPGPNSMLFWLSWILPRSVMFAFFIRGDTAETVSNIYKDSLIQGPATALVKLFQNRIYSLMSQRRAIAFTYGTKLQDTYAMHGKALSIAPLIEDSDLITEVSPKSRTREVGEFRVLFVGRLSPEKGILDLINACALAVEAEQPFQLTIIGHGPLTSSLQDHIEAHDLSRWVRLVGYIAHGEVLMSYYDNHDLLCLPSYTEGVPRVVVEAFARGLYVAATPVGSIPALFADHIRLIHKNSPNSILEAIDWCRSHITEINDAALGLPEVAQLYTLEHHVKLVREQLEQLISTGS